MKEHTTHLMSEMESLKQRHANEIKQQMQTVKQKNKEGKALQVEKEELSKLDIVICALQQERTQTEMKLANAENRCQELQEELRLEKKESCLTITKATEDAENMMSTAHLLMKNVKRKEKELAGLEETTIESSKKMVLDGELRNSVNMKKCLQDERRRSSRQNEKGQSIHFTFSVCDMSEHSHFIVLQLIMQPRRKDRRQLTK